MTRDELYMKKALELAEIAAEQGEVPVGAIVVKRSSGEIIGRGFNRREYGHSPLTHAELVAIEEASRNLGGWRLMGCELFVTLEPCPMCTGAIIIPYRACGFGAYDKGVVLAVGGKSFLSCLIITDLFAQAVYCKSGVQIH